MTSSRQIEHAAAAWLARRDAGPWTATDAQQLAAWLDASTAHRVAFLRLEAAWTEAGRLQVLGAGSASHDLPERGHWSTPDPVTAHHAAPLDLRHVRFAARPPPARPSAFGRRIAAATAALLVITAAAFGAWQLTGREHATYASALGQVRTVTLSDGSTATLSSDTRLEVVMSRRERHLVLHGGEAFFDVSKDPDRPFVVVAGERRVAAVGTRFAVRRDTDELRVVVTEGKVRLGANPGTPQAAQPVALLPAGSVATVGRNGVLVRSVPVADAERYLEWRSGYLTFDDTSLSAAAAEFNRFNARRLEMGDATVAQLRVGGNFRWSNTEGFVRLLEQGFPVQAERHPDRIVLHSR